MKRILMFCVLLAGFLVAFPVLAAVKEAPLKIGVIDTQKVIRDAKAAKNARATFQKDLEAKRTLLEAKGKAVRNIEEQLKSAGQNVASTKLRDDLTRESKEFNRLKSDLEEELKKKDVELTQRIFGEIRQVVLNFSKSEGYTLIMEKSAVLAASDSVDISDKIIKLYDEQKK